MQTFWIDIKNFSYNRNGQEIPESQMEQFRDQVWESLINQKLMEQKLRNMIYLFLIKKLRIYCLAQILLNQLLNILLILQEGLIEKPTMLP